MTSKTGFDEEAANCHNCGAAVSYHYCAVCGQETRLHVASASEFIHEFVGHYVALEGRLWKTLFYLLAKPGFLTAEYIAGRRIRYVQPLRVYLSLSLIFFAVFKLSGIDVVEFGDDGTKPALSTPDSVMRAPATRLTAKVPDSFQLDGLPPLLQAKANEFFGLPLAQLQTRLTNIFFAYAPYAMFCLMPLFALYLKLLYLGTGRRYGEHLLFALHTNAFTFATLGILIAFSSLQLGLLGLLLGFWLVLYLPLAMRRVYGGSAVATGLRWLVLSVLHIVSIGLAMSAAFVLAVLH